MALSILKQVMEEEIKPSTVELCIIPTASRQYVVIDDVAIAALIETVNAKHEEEEAAALAQK